jgi:hypothetical protein
MGMDGIKNLSLNPLPDFAKERKNGCYVFVTVHTLAKKYATELYGMLKKTNKTTCP